MIFEGDLKQVGLPALGVAGKERSRPREEQKDWVSCLRWDSPGLSLKAGIQMRSCRRWGKTD